MMRTQYYTRYPYLALGTIISLHIMYPGISTVWYTGIVPS